VHALTKALDKQYNIAVFIAIFEIHHTGCTSVKGRLLGFQIFYEKGKPRSMTQPLPRKQALRNTQSGVRSIISSLLLAVKTLSLYAEDHSHCQNALSRLHKELEEFLNDQDTLVLEVRDHQILHLGEVVHQGQGRDGELAFALFRDGIMTLAFSRGLEPEETRMFAKILERYKSLPTGAEGDIVTALWESEMTHIEYEAVENILEVDGPSESPGDPQDWLGSLSPRGGEGLSSLKPGEPTRDLKQPLRAAVQFSTIEPALLQLTEDEARRLEEMVRIEEKRDAAQEILNMLADILKQRQEEDFFSYVLDYMVDELRTAFAAKDFEIALKILKTLNQIHKTCRHAGPWAVSKVRSFLLRISEPDFLEGLKTGWSKVPEARIADAKEVLLFFPPVAVLHLGAMLPKVPPPARAVMEEVIVVLASRDIGPFQELLEASDEKLLAILVPLLAKMNGEHSAGLLLHMTRKASEAVRKEALRAIILRRLWVPQALAPLLNDESPFIRQLTARFLGSRKNPAAEALLVEHLSKTRISKTNGEELIACFKVLGKCGTSESIPFLSDTLLKGGLISRFRDSLRRRGAALALLALDSEESRAVLKKACSSRFPGVRNAAQDACKP